MLPVDLTTLPVATSLHWLEAFGLWLKRTPSQKRRERDQKSLDAYLRDVRLMGAWYAQRYGVAFEPGQMNRANLGEYFEQFDNAPRTKKRKRASVCLLIKWGNESGVVEGNPAEWIAVDEVVEEAPRDLLPAEEDAFRSAAESLERDGGLLGLRDSLLVHLMLDAGLRISEAVELKLTDLAQLDRGRIHVLGKGRKHRHPHISSSLADRIRIWLDHKPASLQGTLLTDEQGLAIDRISAWKRFVILREQAGLQHVTPHFCRHQFVMNYIAGYMRGDPLRFPAALKAAAQETGDNVEVLLNHYTGPRESDMRAAVEAISAFVRERNSTQNQISACHACGTSLVAHARYCHNCGTRAAAEVM